MPRARALPELRTERLQLRLPELRDVPELIRFYRENNPFFAKTQTPRTGVWLTESFWRDRVALVADDLHKDRACQFLVFEHGSERVVATLNFTAFIRGSFQACYVGYLLAESHQGQGLMTEAARAGIAYVFGELDLHRVMANYAVSNLRSARVLERLGFEIEGRAPEYLMINGVWTEHVMTALSNPHWQGRFV